MHGRTRRRSRPPCPPAGNAALWIATVSGFCGLAYELLWTRGLLAAVTDDTTYAFTLMLTAFLAGHALGAAIGSRQQGSDPGSRATGGGWERPRSCAALTATSVATAPGAGPRADQPCLVHGRDELLGGSDPDSIWRSAWSSLRLRPHFWGRASHSPPGSMSARAAGRREHRPALWTQHAGRDRWGRS